MRTGSAVLTRLSWTAQGSIGQVITGIWIAVSVYVLVAIVKKRLSLSASLYEILQILSLTMFERLPLDQLLAQVVADDVEHTSDKQLILFE